MPSVLKIALMQNTNTMFFESSNTFWILQLTKFIDNPICR